MVIKKDSKESGFTLVEVLTSTVLIALILTTFMTMFAMGAKTNVASEKIFDNTYLVQNEMEKVIALSKTPFSGDRAAHIDTNTDYVVKNPVLKDGITWDVLTKQLNSTHEIIIRLEDTEQPETKLVIELMNNDELRTEAKMETLLTWEGEAP